MSTKTTVETLETVKPRQVREHPVKGKVYFQINIPPEIGRMLPEGALFMPELVEDGILLRLVLQTRPSWLSAA